MFFPEMPSHPPVRVWPGFLFRRSVVLHFSERTLNVSCDCSIRESPKGPLFVIKSVVDSESWSDAAITVAAPTATTAAKSFFCT